MIVMVELRLQYLIKQCMSPFVLALRNRHRAKASVIVQLCCERLLLPLMVYYAQMPKRNTLKVWIFDGAEVCLLEA